MFNQKTLILVVFLLVYLYLIVSKKRRALAIWIGIGVLFSTGILDVVKILHFINWNVIGIFAGTLVMTELFIYSKVPVLLADILVNQSKTVGSALLWVCIMSGFISAFVENVATVLIIAPIALELSRKLGVSPVPFLVGIAISSNLQGTATLIGDPPSMILAGAEKMTFNDFFIFQGKPGIFFAVELGAATSFFILYLFFKKYRQAVIRIPKEKPSSWVPTWMLGAMIGALALSSLFDPEFRFLAGVICIVFGLFGFLWHLFEAQKRALLLIKNYDWDTTFFLAGVFVMVGALEYGGLIQDLTKAVARVTGDSPFIAFTFIVWFSVLISAFVDNVPYITAMIPVAHKLGVGLGTSPYLLVFGLLIGACLGGNITHIGASANIVATGILRKRGYSISFWEFGRIGLPFTLAATLAGYIFIWFVWK